MAGWGLALLPFGLGAPAPISLGWFAIGGVIYGPFTALSFTLFQNRTPAAALTTVLAARGAALLTASPMGTVLGGALSLTLEPRQVLAVSGVMTLGLAAFSTLIWAWNRRRAAHRRTSG